MTCGPALYPKTIDVKVSFISETNRKSTTTLRIYYTSFQNKFKYFCYLYKTIKREIPIK